MDPRFVTRSIHAWLDYPVAAALIAGPFLLGLGTTHPLARWLAVGTGVAALILTIFTDHQFGLVRILPYSLHLAVDGVVGLVFVLAPTLIGFEGLDAWYYWANGLAVLIVVGLHKPEVPVFGSDGSL